MPDIASQWSAVDGYIEARFTPPEAAFLDDFGVNLKTARALGMTTIKVDDPGVALDELGEVLGFPVAG